MFLGFHQSNASMNAYMLYAAAVPGSAGFSTIPGFLLHKAVEQLLFKRTYAKDMVTKFSPNQKLQEFFEKNMPNDSSNPKVFG